MNDISTNERRLIAALERLDFCIERAAARPASPPAGAWADTDPGSDADRDAGDVPAPVSDEVMALHDRQGATLEAMRTRLEEAHERLAGAGQQAVRLTAANDGLAAANRALIAASADWGAQGADAVRAALQAEIDALHAARAAEIAQMSDILDELDRMLGINTPARATPAAPRPRKSARKAAAPAPVDEPGPDAGAEADQGIQAGATGMSALDAVADPVDDPAADPTLADVGLLADMADADGADTDPGTEGRDDAGDGHLPDAPTPGGSPESLRELVVEPDPDQLPPGRPGARGASLFGGVYDDDPRDVDDEERP